MCQKSSARCNLNGAIGQPYPRRGPLSRQIDPTWEALRERVPASAQVYRYVVATVENVHDHFVQHGSGPNWQGGILTLCTCKHAMRTFREPQDWPDTWIAGFTGVKAGGGRNALVYLTRITAAYSALWRSPLLTQQAKRVKLAKLEGLGDIFEPREGVNLPYAARGYQPPCKQHVHRQNNSWHNDINYVGASKRRAALLVGDPAQTYLWQRPTLLLSTSIGRGQRKSTLTELLDALCL